MALPKLFHVNDDAPTTDWALLIVRLIIGYNLFLNSGLNKLLHLSSMMRVDTLGIGDSLAGPAMVYAAFALGICPLLVFFGLATRYAAFFSMVSLAATGIFVDHVFTLNYLDPGHNSHPEIVWLFFSMYLVVVFTGPGRFSLDGILSQSTRQARPASAR
jgi:putative oxidoreductase